ncbi:hypothetical protein C8F01DRAFT_977054 [Mycena amicta]|nr:hypothetical protein C8F01DRAFT_977054 [Mycena amicta]
MPSPQLVPRKRKHPTRSPSLSPAPYRAFSEQGPSDSDRPAKRRRPAPVSRNRQTTQAEVQRAEASDEFADFKCKVCGWIQHNKRVPDFKRHVKTHQREADDKANRGWACAGVKASEYTGKADVYEYLGERRAGGCRKTFSRRDALKRHLENPNVKCVSEILSRESE